MAAKRRHKKHHAKRHCMSVTKGGKPSKHGRYVKCKRKGAKKWGPPRRKSR